MSDLRGRSAIVTGGAQGIGAAFARALAGAGTDVLIFDLTDAGETAERIAREAGTRCLAHIGDVSQESDVTAAVARAVGAFGKIDVLVNNAAYMSTVPIVPHVELDQETWAKVMAVNLRGPFLMAKHTKTLAFADAHLVKEISQADSFGIRRSMPQFE